MKSKDLRLKLSIAHRQIEALLILRSGQPKVPDLDSNQLCGDVEGKQTLSQLADKKEDSIS
jgi:hypothetical protein